MRLRAERRASPQWPQSWPPGATAGLVLVAAACAALSAVLYELMGPSDVFTP